MMGIYIKGIDMPKNCADCLLEDTYDGYNCRIVEKSANWGLEGRPSWCPLVPVPPHGRLIDADEFFRIFPELISYEFAAPTIIPAEERI